MIAIYILSLSRLVILFAFAFALIGKIRELRAFQEGIEDLKIIPAQLIRFVSLGILINESMIVVCTLLAGKLLDIGFGLAILWLLIFMVVLSKALVQKLRVACNCFGSGSNVISFYDVIRNLLFLSLATLGIIYLNNGGDAQFMSWLDWIIVILMSLVIVTVTVNLHEIALLFSQPIVVR